MSVAEKTSPRILGEGSFGCVLKPAPKCVGKERRFRASKGDEVTVSKVFERKKDYTQEVAASKKVAKVDPSGSHILVPTSHCETTYGNVATHPAANDCEIVQDMRFAPPSTKMYQIKMPYGGQRYDKYIKTNAVKLGDFIRQIIHVLEGVQKLQKNRTCHQDLKASNLLISSQGKVMIIDYSLMLPYEQVYSKKNLHRLRHSYFPYPPEYKIFYLVYKHICDGKSCEHLLPQIIKNFAHYGSDRMQLMKELHGDFHKFVATFYSYVVKNKEKLEQVFLPFAKKMDVYSVGTIMMDMDKYIIKVGASASQVQAYYRVMAELTMIDPRKRISVTQAIKKLKAIL